MSNKLSRRSFLRGSLFVTAGMLAACAAPAGTPQTGGDGGDGAAAETMTLRWDTFHGIGTGWNEERMETFQEMHPEVEIELRPLAGSTQQDNYAKMYAAFAAGDLGEICAFDPSHYHFERAINKEIIISLDELAEADGTDLEEWYPIFMGLQYFQGNLYGLPSWGWAGYDTLSTNAAHFREAGVELPDPLSHDTSMDTIAEWARRFYVDGERFGIFLPHAETWAVCLTRAFNGDFVDAEGTRCLILDDPGAQDGLRWAYQLSVEDAVAPSPGAVENAASAQTEGRITMNWGGSLTVRNLKRDTAAQEIAEDVTDYWQILLPTREDGAFPSQLRGGTWNISMGTEETEMSYQFLKHIAGREGSIGFNLVGGNFAAVRPDVLEALIEEDPVHEWFVPALQNGMPAHAPANSRGREYTDAVTQYLNLLLDPNQPVAFEEGLQNLHDAVQEVLDMDPA